MSSSKGRREPADSQPRISVDFWPYSTHTVAEISVGYRDGTGVHRSRLAYLHLRTTRADVAGHRTDDVLRALYLGLLRRLESGDPADYKRTSRTVDPPAAGIGAPLGATGGTVTQDSLPGM